MSMSRRSVLAGAGATFASMASAADAPPLRPRPRPTFAPETSPFPAARAVPGDWGSVRDLFALADDVVDMSAMLVTAHPAPVRQVIEEYRRRLDADPVRYLEANDRRLTLAAREAAGRYLGVDAARVALTCSTTMGLGLTYNGLRLRQGDEVLTTTHDYFATHESLRLAAARHGATLRRITLAPRPWEADADEIAERLRAEVAPKTRLVALTWVHSSTGLKLPLPRIAAALAEINAGRGEDEQVLLGVDAVHGFGVETETADELGADFLMSGCHKWLFGPRGTGIVALSPRGLQAVRPTVPSFHDDALFAAWLEELDAPPGGNDGPRMSPGGFRAFEHHWALTEAFALHEEIGRQAIAARTSALAGMLKEGIAAHPRATLRTPRGASLSAGIVSFDMEGFGTRPLVRRLREHGIIASAAPYAESHVRLTPSIRNDESDVERALAALHAIS